MQDSEQSVTGWFHALRDGDDNAAKQLWDRYFSRIASLAKNQLPLDPAYDEEDLAVSVFDALYRSAQNGRYESVADREELWGLLVVITRNKLIDRSRRASARKRSLATEGAQNVASIKELQSGGLPPDWSAAVEDECRRLIKLLGDSTLESIALLRLDGFEDLEIAQKLQLGERTVKRKLALIRKRWELEVGI